MGSIGTYREKGQSDKEFFEALYPSTVFHALTRVNGVVYAACSHKEGTGATDPSHVWAMVAPVSGRTNFVVKEQDETMGPADTECPARILALLTPTDSEYANEWRRKCRETLVKRASARERAKQVVAGTEIVTTEKVYFGERYGHFTKFRYSGKGSGFAALDDDGQTVVYVSLSRWKDRDYEVVS